MRFDLLTVNTRRGRRSVVLYGSEFNGKNSLSIMFTVILWLYWIESCPQPRPSNNHFTLLHIINDKFLNTSKITAREFIVYWFKPIPDMYASILLKKELNGICFESYD